MNPKAAALIGIVIIVVVVALIALFVWWVSRQSGVRQSDYNRMKRELRLARQAIADIDEKTDLYLGIDEVLAPQIKHIVRTYNTKQREISA